MKKANRQLLIASELAFRNITVLLLSVLLGIMLDRNLNTKPLFIIIFSLLSIAYIIISLVRLGSKKDEL